MCAEQASDSLLQQTADPEAACLRADARRNRSKILEAAEIAFAEEGVGVPVDEIARRAGVGAGTLYRNFPTKEALFQAVLLRHLEGLAAEARALSAGDRPAEALFAFVSRLAEEGSKRRNLVDALTGAGINIKEALAGAKEEIDAAATVLLRRAQAAGEVRKDVTVADVFSLVMGTCAFAPADTDGSSRQRMITVICDGLGT